MSIKALTVSIVIPVYNEEHHIDGCLQAIAAQTVMPDEVIVVDNNCTDKTIEKARKFPFVKIVRETRQGHAPARNAGFDAATSEIIGRIDAESLIAKNWVERLKFSFSDDSMAAVTGLGQTDFMPRLHFAHARSTLACRGYYWNVHAYFNTITTWGANMAVRQNWWQRVRKDVQSDDKLVHEDQDVALLIAGEGGIVKQDNQLLITTKGQTYLYFPKILHYLRLLYTTKQHHKHLGTFDKPTFQRLGFFHTLPGWLAGFVPGILFFLTGLLFWPLDAIMIERIGSKKWLH
ncbi:MAG: glycosyltransferase family 2 protein [Candidatus Saccharibacteria bacterium]|nr:glycosyltransferase family 2 protein [Candidatus Saccharibacteria bacterium]